MLPVLLTLSSNARSFRAYRRRRLEALLAAERRQLREEQRHWTRAAAAQRADQADALGIPHGELSSGSSGPPTPEAAAEAATVAAQAEALLEAPAPLGLLPPDDLPYEAAYQAWLHLGSLGGWGALPLSALLCLVYAWHVLAFG